MSSEEQQDEETLENEPSLSSKSSKAKRFSTVLGVSDCEHLMYRGLFAEAKRLNEKSSSSTPKKQAFVDMKRSLDGDAHTCSFLDFRSTEVGFDGDVAKKLRLSDLELERKNKKPVTSSYDASDCPLEAMVVDSKRFVRELTVKEIQGHF